MWRSRTPVPHVGDPNVPWMTTPGAVLSLSGLRRWTWESTYGWDGSGWGNGSFFTALLVSPGEDFPQILPVSHCLLGSWQPHVFQLGNANPRALLNLGGFALFCPPLPDQQGQQLGQIHSAAPSFPWSLCGLAPHTESHPQACSWPLSCPVWNLNWWLSGLRAPGTTSEVQIPGSSAQTRTEWKQSGGPRPSWWGRVPAG